MLLHERRFFDSISRHGKDSMFQDLRETIAAYKARDPAARSTLQILLLYPGVKAVRSHRRAHWCYEHGFFFLARWISQASRRRTGIEIHPGAKIGKRLVIDHGMGVVIGETAEIGDDCLIYHGVTLGGTGKEQGKRHPTIGNNVMISTGAKVLGSITVGDNSKIGAGSVVIRDVPPNSTVVGIPGRVAKQDDVHIPRLDLNQVDLPDPIVNAIELLKDENETLKRTLALLEKNQESDRENIARNTKAVSALEDRLLLMDGAGI